MTHFQWIGAKVDCYNPSLQDGSYEFYSSFSYNDETFSMGEFALFRQGSNPKSLRIGRLLSVFYSKEEKVKYKGTVCWYIWARDAVDSEGKSFRIKFDKTNEVIQDSSDANTTVSLEDIQRKCKVIYCSLDEPVYLIKSRDLDADVHFSCRYLMQHNKLVPLFPSSKRPNEGVINSDMDLTELLEECLLTKVTPLKTTPEKYVKRKSNHAVLAVINLDSEGSDVDENRVRSPQNPLKTVKLTPGRKERNLNGSFASPLKRNTTVKRVLNDSFGNLPASPISSYSIVSPRYNGDRQIKIKLKKLDDGLNLKVYPTRLCAEIALTKSTVKVGDLQEVRNYILLTPEKNKNHKTDAPEDCLSIGTPAQIGGRRRRSSRTVERKSYAEYMSPETGTPKKRIRRVSTDSNRSVKTKTPFKGKTDTVPCLSKIDESDGSNGDENWVPSFAKDNSSDDEELNNSTPTVRSSTRVKLKLLEQNRSSKKIRLCRSKTNSNEGANISGEQISESHEDVTPRQKRNIRPPSRYIDHENGETPELNCGSKKYQEHSGKAVNKSMGDVNHSKNIDSDVSATPGQIRKVGRPKKILVEKSKDSPNNVVISEESDETSDDEQVKREPSRTTRRQIVRPERYSTPATVTKTSTPNLRKTISKNYSNKIINIDSDEDDFQATVSKTPKTPKTPKRKQLPSTPKSASKDTPTARARMIRQGIITPSVQVRQKAILKDNTPLAKARTQLHVSFVPKALPCRVQEFADIVSFLEGKLLDGCGGCMYISGVPGTGKTATVTDVIRTLRNSAENGDVPSFEYINVNGMRLSEPRQSYVEIVKQLMGKTVAWEQAQTMLENIFIKSGKKLAPIILVVDELDILCTKRQDVVYNLLDWPTKANAQLIVITIANTMDLPERLLMGRVTSRLGLTRLTFQAYTHKQLQEIVTKRLTGTSAFNPDAIQLVARKVASVSGDARRALDICRRSVEIAEVEGKNVLVSMTHVNQALNTMITQPKVQAIKRCSRLEKLIMQSVVAEVERTGVEETNFTSVFTMLISLAALDGFQMVSTTIALAAVTKLGSCRLLLTDQKCNNIYQRIILNVSADDVYYALTKTDF